VFLVISILILGVLSGFLLRRIKVKHIDRIIMLLVFVLLFLLGAELGTNQDVLSRFGTIGWKAIAISSTATLGSIVGAKLLWIIIQKQKKGN
jgi:uncharacterized membrane protein YbjE (DUF340 family)